MAKGEREGRARSAHPMSVLTVSLGWLYRVTLPPKHLLDETTESELSVDTVRRANWLTDTAARGRSRRPKELKRASIAAVAVVVVQCGLRPK